LVIYNGTYFIRDQVAWNIHIRGLIVSFSERYIYMYRLEGINVDTQ